MRQLCLALAIIFILAPSLLFGQVSLNSGLIAYYSFDGSARDSSINHNHAVVVGAVPTNDRYNKINSAYKFDGKSSYISAPNQEYLNLTNTDYNINFWFKKEASQSTVNDAFIAKRALGTDQGYTVTIVNNRPGNNILFGSNGADPQVISNITLQLDEWHHVSINYNSSLQTATIYIDGVLDHAVEKFPPRVASTSNLIFGKDSYYNDYYFNGILDEIRIYNRELAIEEIQQLSKISTTTDLLAYFPCDGNTKDSTVHHNDGIGHNLSSTTDRYNKANSAFYFNGSSSYIVAPDQDYLDLVNTDYNISFWFKKQGKVSSVNDAFISKRTSGAAAGFIVTTINNQPGNNILYGSSGADPQIVSYATFKLDEWHHVSINYDKGFNQVSIYFDGNLDHIIQGFPPRNHSFSNLFMGRDSNFDDFYFNGVLDEVRIYGRSLSTEEIRELAQFPQVQKSGQVCLNFQITYRDTTIYNTSTCFDADSIQSWIKKWGKLSVAEMYQIQEILNTVPQELFPIISQKTSVITENIPSVYINENVNIFPVPTSNQLTVTFNYGSFCSGTIQIIDLYGNDVKKFVNRSYKAGLNTFELETGDLNPGQYILRIKGSENDIIKKFTIIK